MLAIIGCLFGIFVGIAAAGYMLIQPLAERDKTIAEYKEQDEQLYQELQELRAELEDTKEDKEYLERRIKSIKTLLEQNSYGRDDIKIAKLKEVITTANVKITSLKHIKTCNSVLSLAQIQRNCKREERWKNIKQLKD